MKENLNMPVERFGEEFGFFEPSNKVMQRRLKHFEEYYPEIKKLTYEQSKKGGPKGTSKAIRRIRKGLNRTKYKTQEMYPYIGLPENINNNYYRGNVPQLVKNSHLESNRKIFGNQSTPSHYPKYRM